MIAFTLLAVSSGALINLLVYVVIIALVFWLLWFAINKIPIPEPFKTVLQVIFLVVGVIILIDLLLGLTGNSFLTN